MNVRRYLETDPELARLCEDSRAMEHYERYEDPKAHAVCPVKGCPWNGHRGELAAHLRDWHGKEGHGR